MGSRTRVNKDCIEKAGVLSARERATMSIKDIEPCLEGASFGWACNSKLGASLFGLMGRTVQSSWLVRES